MSFHTYSILWNPQLILFLVDNVPIRELANKELMGVPFPNKQAMRIYSSLWNADNWATMGGRLKNDWTQAPFIVSYRNFIANACAWSAGKSSCSSMNTTSLTTSGGDTWQTLAMDANGRQRLEWVQKKFMIYNYCTDLKRFPQGLPPECKN